MPADLKLLARHVRACDDALNTPQRAALALYQIAQETGERIAVDDTLALLGKLRDCRTILMGLEHMLEKALQQQADSH